MTTIEDVKAKKQELAALRERSAKRRADAPTLEAAVAAAYDLLGRALALAKGESAARTRLAEAERAVAENVAALDLATTVEGELLFEVAKLCADALLVEHDRLAAERDALAPKVRAAAGRVPPDLAASFQGAAGAAMEIASLLWDKIANASSPERGRLQASRQFPIRFVLYGAAAGSMVRNGGVLSIGVGASWRPLFDELTALFRDLEAVEERRRREALERAERANGFRRAAR